MNKSHEDSKEKIISKQQSEEKENISKKGTKSVISSNFSIIKKNKSFTCFAYLFYLIFCKKLNSQLKQVEELRRIVINEESIFHNYFNTKDLKKPSKILVFEIMIK